VELIGAVVTGLFGLEISSAEWQLETPKAATSDKTIAVRASRTGVQKCGVRRCE